MGEVVDIKTRLPKEHIVSFTLCFACFHQWVAVQELGFPLTHRQCPQCNQFSGVLLEALLDHWKEAHGTITRNDGLSGSNEPING